MRCNSMPLLMAHLVFGHIWSENLHISPDVIQHFSHTHTSIPLLYSDMHTINVSLSSHDQFTGLYNKTLCARWCCCCFASITVSSHPCTSSFSIAQFAQTQTNLNARGQSQCRRNVRICILTLVVIGFFWRKFTRKAHTRTHWVRLPRRLIADHEHGARPKQC